MKPTSDDELRDRALGRIGTVLRGKYRLDRVLGVGGMAVVYKATHRNEAEFALKMLHPELSLRSDIRARFQREGRAANSVKHPGVVAVVDDDVAEDGSAFLVMELLDGSPVDALCEAQGYRLPTDAALAIGVQLLDVLAAAHRKGVVHRDIKPANLFVTREGVVKVLDFGIARVKDAAGGASGLQTGTGAMLGTPAFMAPEQAYAKTSEIDGQTDVWAVGATLFTLLTGQSVHPGENASQLMVHAATLRARPLASLVQGVPPDVAAAIDRALAFEKGGRWPSAEAMRDALEAAAVAALGHAPSAAGLARLVAAQPRRREPDAPPAGPAPRAREDGTRGLGTDPTQPGTPPPPAQSRPHAGSDTAHAVAADPRTARTERGGRKVSVAVVATGALVAAIAGTVAVTGGFGGGRTTQSVAPLRSAAPPVASTSATSTPPLASPDDWNPVRPASAPPAASTPDPSPPRPPPQGASSPPRPPSPASTSCNPPEWTDAKGHIHLKPGCN
jgi:serine/threonine-protein kinase